MAPLIGNKQLDVPAANCHTYTTSCELAHLARIRKPKNLCCCLLANAVTHTTTHLFFCVLVCAPVQQQLHHIHVPSAGSPMQCRVAILSRPAARCQGVLGAAALTAQQQPCRHTQTSNVTMQHQRRHDSCGCHVRWTRLRGPHAGPGLGTPAALADQLRRCPCLPSA